MFISTMGESKPQLSMTLLREIVLNEEQQQALGRYFRKGGNFVGVHSAACCLYKNEDYRKVVGGEIEPL